MKKKGEDKIGMDGNLDKRILFANVHGCNEVCNAFTQNECEGETEKRAIENLRNQYIRSKGRIA